MYVWPYQYYLIITNDHCDQMKQETENVGSDEEGNVDVSATCPVHTTRRSERLQCVLGEAKQWRGGPEDGVGATSRDHGTRGP